MPARVLLRKPELLVCDEATAGCDLATDRKIQKTIKRWLDRLARCAVLTIAHRLETIADYDQVVVLHEGKVQEHGDINNLMEARVNIETKQ